MQQPQNNPSPLFFAELCFDRDTSAKYLKDIGYPSEDIPGYIEEIYKNFPKDFHLEVPPESFEEMKYIIRNRMYSLKNTNKVMEYFDKYYPEDHDKIIKIVKRNNSPYVYNKFKDSIDELRYIFEEIIVNNFLLADLEQFNQKETEKEKEEREIFYIWSPYLINLKNKSIKNNKFVYDYYQKRIDYLYKKAEKNRIIEKEIGEQNIGREQKFS